jgi:hypothetical protein
METLRNDDKLQEQFPLIETSSEMVQKLIAVVPVILYSTVRPANVKKGTLNWLNKHGFPEAPALFRPTRIAHADGNKWKALVLSKLYPQVVGIVDDNPGLIDFLPSDYPGVVFLYDHEEAPKTTLNVIPCKTWELVY